MSAFGAAIRAELNAPDLFDDQSCMYRSRYGKHRACRSAAQ